MLRYRADIQTLVYMAIVTGLLVVQWSLEDFNPYLFAAAMVMAVPTSVIAHNHNHLGMWKSKALNQVTDYWLTLFYGFPAFAWIPTHNENHHRRNNREGDYTITYRISESNNLFTLLSYPTISGYYQQKPVVSFFLRAYRKNRRRFYHYLMQLVLLVVFLGAALLWDWRKALLYIVAPQQLALFTVLIFNYLQHVHADEESPVNHSRNFTGRLLNFYLLNNGYHTVHHDKPGLHWSLAAKAHAEAADRIDPNLNERSFWWYLLRTYILAPFVPRFRSRSMRLERIRRQSA